MSYWAVKFFLVMYYTFIYRNLINNTFTHFSLLITFFTHFNVRNLFFLSVMKIVHMWGNMELLHYNVSYATIS